MGARGPASAMGRRDATFFRISRFGENLRIGAIARGRKLNGEVGRVMTLFPILKEMLQRRGGGLRPETVGETTACGSPFSDHFARRPRLARPRLGRRERAGRPRSDCRVTVKKLRTHGLNPDDPKRLAEIGNAITTLRKEGPTGILLVGQYLDFCLDVADRFYIMDRGAIVALGPIAQLDDAIVKEHLTI